MTKSPTCSNPHHEEECPKKLSGHFDCFSYWIISTMIFHHFSEDSSNDFGLCQFRASRLKLFKVKCPNRCIAVKKNLMLCLRCLLCLFCLLCLLCFALLASLILFALFDSFVVCFVKALLCQRRLFCLLCLLRSLFVRFTNVFH